MNVIEIEEHMILNCLLYNSLRITVKGLNPGCRNVTQHQQQSFSRLHYKPGRSLKPQHNSLHHLIFEKINNQTNKPIKPENIYEIIARGDDEVIFYYTTFVFKCF